MASVLLYEFKAQICQQIIKRALKIQTISMGMINTD